MKKEPAHRKQKKPELTFRESAARAFQHALRTAARNNQEIAITIEGQNLIIDAKKLKEILSRHYEKNTQNSELLRFAYPSIF